MLNTECNLHSVFFYATLARPLDHATFTSLTRQTFMVESWYADTHELVASKLAQMVPFKAQDDDLSDRVGIKIVQSGYSHKLGELTRSLKIDAPNGLSIGLMCWVLNSDSTRQSRFANSCSK